METEEYVIAGTDEDERYFILDIDMLDGMDGMDSYLTDYESDMLGALIKKIIAEAKADGAVGGTFKVELLKTEELPDHG